MDSLPLTLFLASLFLSSHQKWSLLSSMTTDLVEQRFSAPGTQKKYLQLLLSSLFWLWIACLRLQKRWELLLWLLLHLLLLPRFNFCKEQVFWKSDLHFIDTFVKFFFVLFLVFNKLNCDFFTTNHIWPKKELFLEQKLIFCIPDNIIQIKIFSSWNWLTEMDCLVCSQDSSQPEKRTSIAGRRSRAKNLGRLIW